MIFIYKCFNLFTIMLLTEVFNIKNGTFTKKDGTKVKIAYIDPKTSQSTYEYKDIIKSKFGAFWIQNMKTWGWFLNGNAEQIYNQKIKPCLEYLDKATNTDRDIVGMIDKLIREVETADIPAEAPSETKETIKAKLQQFKEELVRTVSDADFKKMIEPIIKFKQAQGHTFSFSNAILAWIQDPDARLIKSKGNWAKANRVVKPNAPAIWLWIPTNFKPYSQESKDKITQRFLKKYNVKKVEDLSVGAQERLRIQLKGTQPSSFEVGPYFYDYRFTEQMEGKEDLIGDPNADVPWYDESGEETERTIQLVDALYKLIEQAGVQIVKKDDLGGARGVSSSGKITVLSDQTKNAGLLNTLVHEFAHELLHQNYIKSKNEELKSYFVGKEQGRAKVEQQAELVAWIVLKNFNYDMPTNINYVGIWGLNEKNAASVFDSVAKVAQYIVHGIESNINDVQESKSAVNESFLPNGLQLATMLGFEDIYKQSKRETQMESKSPIHITKPMLKKMVAEAMNSILEDQYDYDGRYDELIKSAMHYLYDLESKVPYSYRAEIHHMVVTLQAMYQDIQRNRELDRM